LGKLYARVSQLHDVVVDPPHGSLDSLYSVVGLHVVQGVEGLFEEPLIEVLAKRCHRGLQRSVLAREVLEVADNVLPPTSERSLARL
jgi:hypothetical protein